VAFRATFCPCSCSFSTMLSLPKVAKLEKTKFASYLGRTSSRRLRS
jgi:hypothetical protein